MVRACNFLRYFYVYLRHLLNIPIPDNYVFVFPKYIRFCKIYSWMSCQENKPMLYYAYSKNKFVILNEIFFEQICIYQKLKNCTHHLRYVIWTIFIPSWAEVLNLQWTFHLVTGSFWSVQKTDFLLLQCFCFLTWISVNSVHWIIRTIWKINYSTEHFDCQGN